MAIVENRASEIGDVILIKASVPIVGLVTLASFTDSVVNETSTKYFYKEFRYSVDGVNFTTWRELTNENIVAVDVSPTATFVIEYRYIRSGSDATSPDLEFNEVELSGDFSEVDCGDAYNDSIFAQFFTCTDLCVLSWMINVLEKMYKKGVLPEYIERGDQSNDSGQDDDFVEFWKSISQYFAYLVCYARQWEVSRATNNTEILIEYLRNQTFIFCGSEGADELKYVMNNTYDEMRHRGTYEIIKTKDDDGREIDGEWHRLFCHLSQCTDWYFSYVFNYSIGWVGDSASPLYQGNYRDKGMTKGYEDDESVSDLDAYPFINNDTSTISITSDTDNDGNDITVLNIASVPAGSIAGVGHSLDEEQVSTDELIKVSPNCEYEITFRVKGASSADCMLSFSLSMYDENGNLIQPSGTKLATSNDVTNEFGTGICFPDTGKYYQVRGIVYSLGYSRTEGDLEGDKLASPTNRLRFSDSNVCYISPYIVLDNSDGTGTSGNIDIYDIKIRHLRTSYATGFIQPSNFIKMKVQNYNKEYSTDKLERIMREFLLPYNSTYKMEYIEEQESALFEMEDFDYLVAKYIWTDQQDLDTRTGIVSGTGDTDVDGQYVGWAFPYTIGDDLVVFGGDNTGTSGTEAVLIDFNKLAETYPDRLSFEAELRAFWYSTLTGTGELEFKIETYKGGTMVQSGTDFTNDGGELVDEILFTTTLTLDGTTITSEGGIRSTSLGELLGTITYNTITKTASLVEN